jgi:molybdate transport system substrate-binding protein
MLRTVATLGFLVLAGSPALAESLRIAAASDLRFAMEEIVAEYRREHPDNHVEVVYGSSGNFHTQIQQGAPYDMYFSADIEYPRELVKSGFAKSDVRPYAIGRIVLWSARLDASTLTLDDLATLDVAKIAIANPAHAPYGKRAAEALRATGVWDDVESKLVYGENIAQTAQFVQSGNAQIGILALSLALSPQLQAQGGYYLIPDALHEPLEQGFIITKRATANSAAETFAQYMDSASARSVMRRYGFVLPGETSVTAN